MVDIVPSYRDQTIEQFRSEIGFVDNTELHIMNDFQNCVLRPILKFQHPLFISYFKYYALAQKQDISFLDSNELRGLVRRHLQNDAKLKNYMIGASTALFTSQQLDYYFRETKEINKRIISMLIERIFDGLNA